MLGNFIWLLLLVTINSGKGTDHLPIQVQQSSSHFWFHWSSVIHHPCMMHVYFWPFPYCLWICNLCLPVCPSNLFMPYFHKLISHHAILLTVGRSAKFTLHQQGLQNTHNQGNLKDGCLHNRVVCLDRAAERPLLSLAHESDVVANVITSGWTWRALSTNMCHRAVLFWIIFYILLVSAYPLTTIFDVSVWTIFPQHTCAKDLIDLIFNLESDDAAVITHLKWICIWPCPNICDDSGPTADVRITSQHATLKFVDGMSLCSKN